MSKTHGTKSRLNRKRESVCVRKSEDSAVLLLLLLLLLRAGLRVELRRKAFVFFVRKKSCAEPSAEDVLKCTGHYTRLAHLTFVPLNSRSIWNNCLCQLSCMESSSSSSSSSRNSHGPLQAPQAGRSALAQRRGRGRVRLWFVFVYQNVETGFWLTIFHFFSHSILLSRRVLSASVYPNGSRLWR